MKEKLLIIGAGGHGKVAADIAIKMNKWKEIAFLDDNKTKKKCMDLNIIGETVEAYKFKDEAEFFIAIGNNSIREKELENFLAKDLCVTTLVHPESIIGRDVEIGVGTVVMPGGIINSSTIVGKGCILNTGSSIDHDNFIDDYVHISPGVRTAGNVKVGKGSWLGIGTIVSNNVNICSNCQFGAGTVVINDISEPGTYIGVPTRKVLRK